MGERAEVKDITYRAQRSCLFNFIAYTEDKSKLSRINSFTDILLSYFPAKVMILFGDREAKGDGIDVSEEPEMGDAYSRVHVELRGKRIDEVELLALPLLVPDYPVYTLWLGNPSSSSKALGFFKQISERLLFDAEPNQDLKLFCQKMHQILDECKREIVDINWAKIFGWRSILMELIDSEPRLAILTDCQKLQISYQKGSMTQSLYLFAWLASRLNWSLEPLEGDSIKVNNSFTLQLQEEDKEGSFPGEILSFSAANSNGGMVELTKKPKTSQVMVHLASHDACDLPFTLYLPDVNRGSHYLAQLLWAEVDSHYPPMLNLLSKIIVK